MSLVTSTRIEYPIKINIEGVERHVGQFFATINENLDGINIQLYISDKATARENMESIKSAYDEFYKKIIERGIGFGYEFLNTDNVVQATI